MIVEIQAILIPFKKFPFSWLLISLLLGSTIQRGHERQPLISDHTPTSLGNGSVPGSGQSSHGNLLAMLRRQEEDMKKLGEECSEMFSKWSQSHREMMQRHKRERESMLSLAA